MQGIWYAAEPKIGFPHYARGGLLQLFRKIPFGWRDIRKHWDRGCNFCGTTVRLGREKDEQFRYCPKCLIKTTTP